jgi:FG-GAP repeat
MTTLRTTTTLQSTTLLLGALAQLALVLALLTLVLALGACSYDIFNELEEKAPATRIVQDGEISSRNFGDAIVGLPRGDKKNGAVLAIIGNADSALASVLFSEGGSASLTEMNRDDMKDWLDNPNKMHAMAAAPSTKVVGSYQGPFVYLGSTAGASNTVRVVDVSTFKTVRTYKAPTVPQAVTEYGVGVAAAELGGGGSGDDLVVGGKDALVLRRAKSGGSFDWPDMEDGADVVVKGAPDWPVGQFETIIAGDLDQGETSEDEVVVALPERNTVMVVHHVADCFANPTALCTNALKLPAPSGADHFGASLLIADVDNDGKQELVVGAAGNDRVYIYDIEKGDFTAGKLPAESQTLQAPGDAKSFGKSLAFGKFIGGVTKDLLAVGAPDTAVDGTIAAGRIYLFDDALKPVGQGTQLASPTENMLIGRKLTTLPLRSSSTTSHDVLVASGRDAVFIFFANLSEAHKDIRR